MGLSRKISCQKSPVCGFLGPNHLVQVSDENGPACEEFLWARAVWSKICADRALMNFWLDFSLFFFWISHPK